MANDDDRSDPEKATRKIGLPGEVVAKTQAQPDAARVQRPAPRGELVDDGRPSGLELAHGPRERIEYLELDDPPRPPTTKLDLDGPAALRGDAGQQLGNSHDVEKQHATSLERRAERRSQRILPKHAPPSAVSLYLTARLVGLVSLLAFVSLHVQVIGLLGEDGIVPLGPRLGRASIADAPSLFFLLGGGDLALHAVAVLGELASLLLLAGVLPGAAALVAWLAYLSFVSVGWPFLPLQWDTLLCEALVLVAAISPWDRRFVDPRALPEPPAIARIALIFLVCRLHLASGLVKLLSGDPTWRDLTALDFHFETQPLPGPLSPWMHHLPRGLHGLMVLATYAIEIVAPLFVVFRGGRAAAFAAFVLLQLLITVTGNYGFFNVLTIVLSLPLLDDEQLGSLVPRGVAREAAEPTTRGARSVPVRTLVVAPLVLLGGLDLVGSLGMPLPRAVDGAVAVDGRLHLTSAYGLFAVMTTERTEIIFERSEDGERWAEYAFRYKPDELERGLPLAPFHMPRLDWLLWFAALGDPDDSPWVLALEDALLEDRPSVRALLAARPFGGPPRYVRAVRYRYRFATDGTATWVRDRREPYGPTLERSSRE